MISLAERGPGALAGADSDTLARNANHHHDEMLALAQFGVKKLNESAAEAILCGQALIEAKKIVGHGKWLKWLEKKCPKISHDKASKCMRVAKNPTALNLTGGRSATQLFIACGIDAGGGYSNFATSRNIEPSRAPGPLAPTEPIDVESDVTNRQLARNELGAKLPEGSTGQARDKAAGVENGDPTGIKQATARGVLEDLLTNSHESWWIQFWNREAWPKISAALNSHSKSAA